MFLFQIKVSRLIYAKQQKLQKLHKPYMQLSTLTSLREHDKTANDKIQIQENIASK